MHFVGNVPPGFGVFPATDQWSVHAVSHPVTAGRLYITPLISNKVLAQLNEEEGDVSFIHLFLWCNHSINTRVSQQAREPVVNGSSLPWDCIVHY